MRLFFSMKRGHSNVVGTGKNMWELYVSFFMWLKIKKVKKWKTAPGDSKTHYWQTWNQWKAFPFKRIGKSEQSRYKLTINITNQISINLLSSISLKKNYHIIAHWWKVLKRFSANIFIVYLHLKFLHKYSYCL